MKYPQKPSAVGKFYEKPPVRFILLAINRKNVKARMGFVNPSYYHIYGSIPRDSYKIRKVKRDKKVGFFFEVPDFCLKLSLVRKKFKLNKFIKI